MKTKSLCLELGSAAVLLSAIVLCPGVTLAQQGYGYPPGYEAPAYPQYPQGPAYAEPPGNRPQVVSPQEFFPLVGRRFGDMFRRLFYGDGAPPEYPANGYSGGQNLDAPPSYGSHYGPSTGAEPATGLNIPPRYEQPDPLRYGNAPQSSYPQRYETPRYESPRYEQPQPVAPPQQSQRQPALAPPPENRYSQPSVSVPKNAPGPKKKSTQSSPPKKYTPPTITRSQPIQPKIESQPPATTAPSSGSSDFYPLPGNKPNTEKSSPPSTASTKASNGSGTKPATTSGGSGSFLKGKRTGKEGRVTSPYPPYQELDVTGLSTGSLALDPTTQKVFEVP